MGANSSTLDYEELDNFSEIGDKNSLESKRECLTGSNENPKESFSSREQQKSGPKSRGAQKKPSVTQSTVLSKSKTQLANSNTAEVKVQREVTDQMKKLRKTNVNRSVKGSVLEAINEDFFREDVEKLELKDMVGQGAWGNVRKAQFRKPGSQSEEFTVCAVKEFTTRTFKGENFPGHWEISILMKLNHRNIVKYISHTYSQVEEHLIKGCLIMEYCEMGSLRSFLEVKKSPKLSDVFVINLCKNITAALYYIHSTYRMVHRDVKPANILMEKVDKKDAPDGRNCSYIFKLCDFGCARRFESQEVGPVTAAYAAPEFLWGEFHRSGACDIYSLGMTMLQCSSGEIPTVIKDDKSLQKLVDQQARQLGCIKTQQFKQLATQCIWMDPAERITTKGLLTNISKINI